MALTRNQILDALADLGIEVSRDNKVSRKSVNAALQWDLEGVQALAEKLNHLGISPEPLKAPFHIELSPELYREMAIKSLKAKRPDMDWENILPQVPKEEKHKDAAAGFNDVDDWQDGIFLEMLQKKLMSIIGDWDKVRAVMDEFNKYEVRLLIAPKVETAPAKDKADSGIAPIGPHLGSGADKWQGP
jgi:hypothetical protein